jgi:hypothetical protein
MPNTVPLSLEWSTRPQGFAQKGFAQKGFAQKGAPYELANATARLQAIAEGDAPPVPAITDPSRKPTGGIARDNPCTWPLVACLQTRP